MKSKSNPEQISRSQRFGQIMHVLSKYKAFTSMSPDKARMILEDLGPTYVKLGQILSSRSDLLPKEYTSALEQLRSNVDPMPFEEVKAEIETAYGKPLEEVFVSVEQTPLGSASMAQVHRAVLKDGSHVVVKVQRPHLYEQMKVDVEMMKKAAKLLSMNKAISSVIDLNEVIDEFWTTSQQEMDFTKEANNAIRFAKNNKDVAYVRAPKIDPDLNRKNILVMEEIKGTPIDSYQALSEQGYSRHEIAMKLGVNFLDQVLRDGFFHADPHSGNLKIDKGQIVWLDFGMMGEISHGEAKAMREALQALASRDLSTLTNAILAIGIPPQDLDYVGFSNALDTFLNKYLSQSFDELDLAVMVTEAVEVCGKYSIQLPEGITMLARSLLTIQGTLKDLDPTVNMTVYIAQEKQALADIDWQKELTNTLKEAYGAGQSLIRLPAKLDRILNQLQRGQLQVGLKLSQLDTLLPEINHIVDRLVITILIAALLVGSSIVCTTNMKPKFLDIPLLGFAGFFVSFCLSIWLFYKMLFHPKKGDGLF